MPVAIGFGYLLCCCAPLLTQYIDRGKRLVERVGIDQVLRPLPLPASSGSLWFCACGRRLGYGRVDQAPGIAGYATLPTQRELFVLGFPLAALANF